MGRKNGRRVAISLVCWLLSSVGVLMSLMMIVGSSIVAFVTDPTTAVRSRLFYLGVATAFAWVALLVMNVAWLKEKPVSWLWPVAGGVAGLTCTAVFYPMIFLFLPCVVLGVYLCFAHFAGTVRYELDAGQK